MRFTFSLSSRAPAGLRAGPRGIIATVAAASYAAAVVMGLLWWLFPSALHKAPGGGVERAALLGEAELAELAPPAESADAKQ